MSNSITVKRQVVVKSIITDNFKEKATNELLAEIKLLDGQINHLQVQLNQLIQQFQQNSVVGLTVRPHDADQIMNDLNLKLQQLFNLKQNLQQQIDNIKTTKNEDVIITGSLENYVELQPGDNIYEKLIGKEIIIKDGIIQEINS